MEKKHRILFSTPALFGHVGPSLAIAKKIIAKGHKVGYTSGSPARSMVEKIGIRDFFPRDKYHKALLDKKYFTNNPYKFFFNLPKVFTQELFKHCYEELINAFESFKPDMLYIDTMDFHAAAVAENYNLPYAHGSAATIWYNELDIPPFGTDWDINAKWLNRIKLILYQFIIAPFFLRNALNQKKALKEINPSWDIPYSPGISPYLFMFYSTDAVEYHRKMFIPQVFYVGPSIFYPEDNEAPDFPWEKLDKNRPLVYIATGTMFSDYYKEFYTNALNALSEERFPIPVQVVMAMGNNQLVEELGDAPPNFIVVPYAPQLKLLQKASVVITHGGVNSVNETLLYGKPMLVVHWGADRLDMGKRIEYRGAGICVAVENATEKKISESVIALLENPKYKKSSKVIMESYAKCNGPETAAELMLQVAGTGKPVLRKKGAPITLEKISDLRDHLNRSY